MPANEYQQRIGIVVFGTDQKGEMFQEDTSTIVVAANWANVRLRHAVAPGAEVIVFNKDNGNQAEFVLEQQIAPGEVKLALRDRTVDMWQLDFGVRPGLEPEEGLQEHIVCIRCHSRESVRLSEQDVSQLLGAGMLKRYCSRCMADTVWEEDSVVEARAALAAAASAAPPPPPPPAAAAAAPPPPAPAAAAVAATRAPAPAAVAAAPPPAPPQPEASLTEQLLRGDRAAEERRTSKRISLKTKARVRRVGSSEVVEPINASRGGICFESRASYELDEVVWVAMHYRDGDANPMETPSRVVRVSRGGSGRPHSYGISFQV
jgi:pyruvate/2-oxoglutarate dehydrogenase complex dihydrolipoamide acyltransferase (E2) component